VITFGVVPSVAWPSERVTGWSIRVWTSELRGEYHQGRRMKSSSQRCVRPSNPACPFYASPLSLLSRVRLSSPHGHPTAEAVGGGGIFSKWQAMAQDRISLVDHLDGMIFLADPARQPPPGRCVYLIHTFQWLGQAYQDAALAQRKGCPVRLYITQKYIFK
jgi:hypothetical protein